MKYNNYHISLFTLLLGLYFSVVILGVVDFFGHGSVLKYIAILPLCASLKNINHFGLGKPWRPVTIYYLFAILSVIWTVDVSLTKDTVVSFASFLLLISCVRTHNFNYGEIAFLKQMLLWSSRLTLIIVCIFANFSEGRLLISETVMKEDPNYLCAYFYFGIAYCFQQVLQNRRKIFKTIYLIELLLYFYTIICTGSRGGALGGIAVVFIVIMKATNLKSLSSIISKCVPILVIILLIPLMARFVDSEVVNRFSIEELSTSDGSGRYQIWSDAINAFMSFDIFSTLFGKGIGASRAVASLYHFQRVNVMHNVLLENLIGLGIIGTFLYLTQLFTIWRKAKLDYLCLSVFIGSIIFSLSVSILALKPVWNIQILIACIYYSQLNSKRITIVNDSRPILP